MTLDDIKNELKHKERSINDLISYIEIRNSNVPNYSLLLGAGASVNSGIKSGYQLCETWRKEIFELLSGEKYSDKTEAINFLIKHDGGWYNESNEYSSLFEKKFDLPSQRRRFVENEVDGAIPSIGYAYLTSLSDTQNRYFDTIFTTNFDDLINEAFYQFSNIRPLVCAQDSSIHSMSLTSTRPKIVKLHGDYLFDDIKSTLRETESLENNIKEKLIEFSKNNGMIVIGYAGNDRSILDVINHLLRSDSYLKNGLYWCIRKGDEIRPEVRKLLWKDKVYFVEIEGFDELLAEIHHKVKGDITIFENTVESKHDKIIKKLVLDENKLIDKSNFIKKDLLKINKSKTDLDISKLIMELNDEKYLKDLSESEFKSLLKIDNLIKKKDLIDAEKLAEAFVNNIENDALFEGVIRRLIHINKENKNISSAIKYADKLIEIDSYNYKSHIIKSEIFQKLNETYDYLIQNKKTFEKNYIYLNQIIIKSILLQKNTPNQNTNKTNDLLDLIEASLKLEPSLSNPAWLRFFQTIDLMYQEKNSTSELKEKNQRIKDKLECMKSINNEHISYLKTNLERFPFKNDDKEISFIEEFNNLKNLFKSSSRSKKEKIFNIICEQYQDFFSSDSKARSNFEHSDIYKFLNDKDYKEYGDSSDVSSYFMLKSIFALQENDLDGFKDNIRAASNKSDYIDNLSGIIDSYLDVLNEAEMALEILSKSIEEISQFKYKKLLSDIFLKQKYYEKSLVEIEKSFDLGLSFEDYISGKIFIYINSNQYEKAINLFELQQEKIKSPTTKAIILLNSSFAKKELGKGIDKIKVRNIIAQKLGSHYSISAHCLLEEKRQAIDLIKKEIKHDKSKVFTFKAWPIIPKDYLDEALSERDKESLSIAS